MTTDEAETEEDLFRLLKLGMTCDCVGYGERRVETEPTFKYSQDSCGELLTLRTVELQHAVVSTLFDVACLSILSSAVICASPWYALVLLLLALL